MTQSLEFEKQILDLTRRWYPAQVKWRRHLHQYPETSNKEFETTAFLKTQLRKLGLKLRPLRLPTGVVAELRGATGGPTVAIRSDIDALPILEQTGLPFASKLAGKMHACGHDIHMATVLGTAAVLAELKGELRGKVRFLFQPAEEEPPGGARLMIEAGALEGVDTIFGLHVDPLFPIGTIGLCDGPMMAHVYDFDIAIIGHGSHAARPQLGVDAIVVAAAVVEALQSVVSRRTDPSIPLVLTVGKISGGAARNVIAENAHLVCTARTLSPEVGRKLPGMIKKTVDGVCRAHGASCKITTVASYPMLINDPKTNQLFGQVFGKLFGSRAVRQADPVLGGEDFAYYLQRVPGAMALLGIKNPKIGADKPWHSSKFIADESALTYGTGLLAGTVLKYSET